MPFNYDVPTRAEILKHSKGNIIALEKWLIAKDIPEEAREAIYSDLESYDYEERKGK